jgi:hypothetical protein
VRAGECGGAAVVDTCGVCGGNDENLGCDGAHAFDGMMWLCADAAFLRRVGVCFSGKKETSCGCRLPSACKKAA